MIWFFLIIGVAINLIEYRINRRLINAVSVITLPYLVIVPLNNFIAVNYGFYKVNDDVLVMLMMAFGLYAIGSFIVDYRKRVSKTKVILDFEQNAQKFNYYKIGKMKNYCLIIELIMGFRLIRIILMYGFKQLSAESGINLLGGGEAHLFFTIYPLIPIMFYYWLEHKKEISYLCVTIIAMVFTFLSFTKYHSIGLAIMIYLFVSFENRKYLKKGLVLLLTLVSSLFIVNYVVGFILANVFEQVNNEFYLNHLWNYIAGSIIHDNYIFTSAENAGVSFVDKFVYCFMPLPNMLLSFFSVEGFKANINVRMLPTGMNGEYGNVLDFIGFLYPTNGNFVEIIFFGIIMLVLGAVFTIIHNKAIKTRKHFNPSICVIMTFFEVLAFFAVYMSSSMVWEILVFSIIMPYLFDRRVKIKYK